MTFEKDYLKLLGHIGTFTRNVTGTSVVDAYFGPENLLQTRSRSLYHRKNS